VLVMLLSCRGAAKSAVAAPASTSIDAVAVADLTPRFLSFYDSASARPISPDERWLMWKRLYNFAAVPPTPYGQQLARQLLDSAWSRYPAALPRIRQGVAGLGVTPDSVLRQVVHALGCGEQVRLRLTLFVGGFEGNAFAYGVRDGRSLIAIPVEAGDPLRALIHETAHAVHRTGCTTFASGYGQSLAELVITEGVAMRTVERLLPGRPANYYIEGAPEWLEAAHARRSAILRGVRENVAADGPDVVQRFTFGEGTTGLRREAYYAGWEVVGALLRDGMSLQQIATTPPGQFTALIDRALGRPVGR